MVVKTPRNYKQQFRTLVKHRKANVPDADEFVSLFNDYLLQYNIKPIPAETIKALEGDINGGVSELIQAYLSFFGVRLAIEGVSKADYRNEETMKRRDQQYLELKDRNLSEMRMTNIHGPNVPRIIRLGITNKDGVAQDVYVSDITDPEAWEKIKEGMLILIRRDIANRKMELDIRNEKTSAPKALRGD